MIVACVGTYEERINQTVVGIKRLRSYVDRYVVIIDESVTKEQADLLDRLECEVYIHPWEDSMVKMRNQYLAKVQTGDWIIVHDPDEHFNQFFCQNVRKFCEKADADGISLLLINSHDTTIKEDGSMDHSTSDFFKNLIFKKSKDSRYEGVGEIKEVHETLIMQAGAKAVRLPTSCWYEHIKYWHEVWERAARNVFMAGGGNNVGEKNVAWPELRKICDELGLDTWPKARDYFRQGDINSALKEWLWLNRYEGFDYHHEMLEFGKWYFDYLHPEEKTYRDGRVWEPVLELEEGSPPEVMRYVEQTYMEVLGRHAEQAGKDAYTQAILQGAIKRDDLPTVLKQSPEYQAQTDEKSEAVRIRIPIQAQVNLTEDLLVEAIMKSKTYWEGIKPALDIGRFIRESLSEEDWERFFKDFYKTKPSLDEFIHRLTIASNIGE